jgi:hypothetical protein
MDDLSLSRKLRHFWVEGSWKKDLNQSKKPLPHPRGGCYKVPPGNQSLA